MLAIAGAGLLWATDFFSRPSVAVDVNGNVREVRTGAHTVGEALREADVLLDPMDLVTPPLDSSLKPGMTISVVKANQLVLELDGDVRRVYTHAIEPLQILEEQGIILGPQDRLYVDHREFESRTTLPTKTIPRYLQVIHAKGFRLFDGEQPIEGYSTASNVGEVLQESNILLYLADRITPPPETPLTDGLEIFVTRSSPVHVQIDDQDLHTRAVGMTVNDVLNVLGLSLTGQDYTIPAENADFTPGMEIEVIRVVETLEVEQQSIPFQTVTVRMPDLPPNEQRIIQIGAPGLQESRVRVRRENDKIVSRTVQETWTVVEPVPQIVASGRTAEGNQ